MMGFPSHRNISGRHRKREMNGITEQNKFLMTMKQIFPIYLGHGRYHQCYRGFQVFYREKVRIDASVRFEALTFFDRIDCALFTSTLPGWLWGHLCF